MFTKEKIEKYIDEQFHNRYVDYGKRLDEKEWELNKRIKQNVELLFDKKFKRHLEDIQETKQQLKNDLEVIAHNIFSNMDFVNSFTSRMERHIREELRNVMSEKGLNEFLSTKMREILKYQVQPMIKNVVEEVVKQTNRKLKRDYQITKKLCYSIDAELRHTLADLPISANADEIIKNKVNDLFSGNNLKTLIGEKAIDMIENKEQGD